MSLLKLKSKTEPLYTKKSIINCDDLNTEIKEDTLISCSTLRRS